MKSDSIRCGKGHQNAYFYEKRIEILFLYFMFPYCQVLIWNWSIIFGTEKYCTVFSEDLVILGIFIFDVILYCVLGIDEISRVLFPVGFGIFSVTYWLYYLNIRDVRNSLILFSIGLETN
jgi:hypothetical protein